MGNQSEAQRRGVEALNARRFEDAERWLTLALDGADSRAAQTRARTSLAYLIYERGDPAAAFRAIDVAIARGVADPPTQGVALCQKAHLLVRAGRHAEALPVFDAGIGLLTEPVELGRALINRGGVWLAQGRPEPAREDFRAAAAAMAAAGHPVEEQMAVHNLGYAEYLCGDLVGALTHLDRARPLLSIQSEIGRATCSQDRAEVLLAAGLLTEGRAELEDAAATYEREGVRQYAGEARLTLARSMALHDPHLAAAESTAAEAAFSALGAESWAVQARATRWSARIDLGEADQALLTEGDQLADQLAGQGLRWAVLLVRLQQLRLQQSCAGTARRAVVVPRSAPLETRLLAHDVRAAGAARAGRPARALRELRAGLDDLHAWQSSFGSLDLQTNVVGRGVRLAVRGLTLAAESRSDSVLFEWSERARMLASRVQPVRAPQDAETVADLAELRAGPAPAREVELRRRVRERAWRAVGSREVADPVSVADIQAGLGPQTALLAHVVTAHRLVALVVTEGGTTRHDLGGRGRLDAVLGGLLPDLDMAAADLPEPMAGAVRGALARRLAAVAELLVAPVLGDLGGRRLVVTPSGVLAGVPWSLLPGLAGRPVTVAQSATSWLARRAEPLRTASAGFVAGPRVVRAGQEVSATAAAWPEATVLVGAAATAGAVSDLAGRVDVLHVAAHGRHSAENPLFSGLQLADGVWFGYDIDQLAAVPDVVLLSACEVGRSSVRWGEELIGMTAAWLHAGARCVVASPSAVNDAAAHDTLVAVHGGLAAGLDPARALAEAVPAASADAAPAPFTCFG